MLKVSAQSVRFHILTRHFYSTEKAAFDALSEADEYEDLEDDFLFIANDGKVAIEEVEEKQQPNQNPEKDTN
jgi:hypothetical protein